MKRVLYGLIVLSMLLATYGTAPVSALEPIEIVSVNYPSVVAPGQTFCFSVTVKVNSGQLLESRGDMLRNTDGNLFGTWPHIAVVGTVNTGASYTFNCYNPGITAPIGEGTYQSKWRVWRAGAWDGPEVTLSFEVRNGGGGGGGGGITLTCPNELPITIQDPVRSFHTTVAVVPTVNYIEVVEYAAVLSGQYCKSNVTYEADKKGFTLSAPNASISSDNKLNLSSSTFSFGTPELQYIYGVLSENTDYPGMLYYGFRANQQPDQNTTPYFFMLSSQHDIRFIDYFEFQWAYAKAYAYLPALNVNVVRYLANAQAALKASNLQNYLLLIGSVVIWFGGAVLMGAPATPPQLMNMSPMNVPAAKLQSSQLPLTPRGLNSLSGNSIPTPQAETLFVQQYGAMKDWSDLTGLTLSRDRVSAFTEFSVTGGGFTPNSLVYYEFGLPGQEAMFHDAVLSDAQGNAVFTIVMPEPADVPLGKYLLSAFDDQVVDKARQELFDGSLSPSHFHVGIAAVDVVEDVTPPTILIASPTATSYSRCDLPIVNFQVTDDLSGVAKVNAWLDQAAIQNGASLDMLFWKLGTHSLDVQAFDKVDLEQDKHLEFQLQATIKGTQCAMTRFQLMKLFKNNGSYASISALLSSTDRALATNKPNVAKNNLLAITKLLQAQKKKIDSRAYDILVMDITALLQKPIR